MIKVIFLLAIGTFFAYISHGNFMPVTFTVGPYVFTGVPLFYVIIGSLVSGLLLSYLINLIPSISQSFHLKGKEKEIEKNKNEVLELTKRVRQLEVENEKLKKGIQTKSAGQKKSRFSDK